MTESQFEQLFKEHFTSLSNVAYAVVKDHDQAKDIAQQVFIKFWDKRDSVNIDDNIKAYLKRAIVNTSLNHIEKVKKLKLEDDFKTLQLIDSDSSEAREKNIVEAEKAIKIAVANLPDKCQTVFSLSRYEGMTNQEISDYLEVSIKAVEKHISRALRELREKLKPYMNLISIIILFEVGLYCFNLFMI